MGIKRENKMKYTAKKVLDEFINFFKSYGHKEIKNANLVPENDPTLLFINSGMAPIKKVFTGEEQPESDKMCNVQTCIRTIDIEDVGDDTHLTAFHMLGNWTVGGYDHGQIIKQAYEFLVDRLKIDKSRLFATYFEGDKKRGLEADDLSKGFWEECGIEKSHILGLPFEDTFWRMGDGESPCGPCSEVFFDKQTDIPSFLEGGEFDTKNRYVEIWNAGVFMQYLQTVEGNYLPLKFKSVDAGAGLERLLATLNDVASVYETEIFLPIINYLNQNSKAPNSKSIRIIADHVRAAVLILNSGAEPSNVRAGYVLRNLIRRSLRHMRTIEFDDTRAQELLQMTIDNMEEIGLAPEWRFGKDEIINKFIAEQNKFSVSLRQGLKVFEEAVSIEDSFETNNGIKNLKASIAFKLYDTFGFPIEITRELLSELGFGVDESAFAQLLNKHKEISKAGDAVFKSGLADTNPETIKLHTATHLMHAALKKVLGEHVAQKGSNITPERLRFDFNFERKLLPEELLEIEKLVNLAIEQKIEVDCQHMTPEEAKKSGAIGLFDSKYGDDITVYTMGDFSKEICSGPHVKNTGELGHFKIVKEESTAANIRRIKAVLN